MWFIARYQYKKIGKTWQINSALIAKINLMFLITDLQVAINLTNRFDFFNSQFWFMKKFTHPMQHLQALNVFMSNKTLVSNFILIIITHILDWSHTTVLDKHWNTWISYTCITMLNNAHINYHTYQQMNNFLARFHKMSLSHHCALILDMNSGQQQFSQWPPWSLQPKQHQHVLQHRPMQSHLCRCLYPTHFQLVCQWEWIERFAQLCHGKRLDCWELEGLVLHVFGKWIKKHATIIHTLFCNSINIISIKNTHVGCVTNFQVL